MPIAEAYMILAVCLKVQNPLPPPKVVIGPHAFVSCGALKGACVDESCTMKYGKKCSGMYKHTSRTIYVGWATEDAIPHELVHDLLCQRGQCDGKHSDPIWHGKCFSDVRI